MKSSPPVGSYTDSKNNISGENTHSLSNQATVLLHQSCNTAWVCNDLNYVDENAKLVYYAKTEDELISAGKLNAQIPECSSEFQGYIKFTAPNVNKRTKITISLALVDENKNVLHDTELEIEIFKGAETINKNAWVIGKKAEMLAEDLNIYNNKSSDLIIISDYELYLNYKNEIDFMVENGAAAAFMELEIGEYRICGSEVIVKLCGMLPVHFVSRNTGHSLVDDYKPNDFRLWYDENASYITPILHSTFTADDFEIILSSGNINSDGDWARALAAGERKQGKGSVKICQMKLAGRVKTNPVAYDFAKKLLSHNMAEDKN